MDTALMEPLNADTPDKLGECIEYMRESEENRQKIALFFHAATSYLANTNVPEPDAPDALYDLARCGLTLHWWDHRDDTDAQSPLPASLRNIINQLKQLRDIRAAAAEG